MTMRSYSLRALFLALIALSALGLGGTNWWNGQQLARVSWLDPSSPEATFVIEQYRISISETVRGHRAVFHPRYKSVDDVFSVVGSTWSDPPARYEPSGTNSLYQYIDVQSADKPKIEAAIRRWQRADALRPGDFVINGIVRNSEGQPVVDAWVDLLGPISHLQECRTRKDGTFTMPLKASSGRYSLTIQEDCYGVKPAVETRLFTLDSARQELIASIRLP